MVLASHPVTATGSSWFNPAAEGWVDDFYLRDRAVRRDGGQVELADAAQEGEALVVAVRPVGNARGPLTWVDPSTLSDVGAQEN